MTPVLRRWGLSVVWMHVVLVYVVLVDIIAGAWETAAAAIAGYRAGRR